MKLVEAMTHFDQNLKNVDIWFNEILELCH